MSGTELDHARDIIAQVSKLGAGLASKGLGLNTEIALETADNAVTNNFMEHPPEASQFMGGAGNPELLDNAVEQAKVRTKLDGEDWDSLSIQEQFRRINREIRHAEGKIDSPDLRQILRVAQEETLNILKEMDGHLSRAPGYYSFGDGPSMYRVMGFGKTAAEYPGQTLSMLGLGGGWIGNGANLLSTILSSSDTFDPQTSLPSGVGRLSGDGMGKLNQTSKLEQIVKKYVPVEKKDVNRTAHLANVGEAFGRRPHGYVRTNEELIQDIATRAERKIGGTGNVAGTKKHTYAKRVIEKYQKKYGGKLIAEKNWKNGEQLNPEDPTKGSSRFDVYDRDPNIVYDYKFLLNPGKGLKSAQVAKIKQHAEQGATVKEINPMKPGDTK